ncbi:hypothetical protein J7L00_07550 [Candidatus Bathyarchaeota archaeon]|nr:hypothetical protein [Candidatus Bathyarchaeota archaeon]
MTKGLKAWEDLYFDIVKEVWNTYYLENGVRLRGRTILKRLMRRKVNEKYEFNADFQNVYVAIAPPHLKGNPGPPLTPTEIKNAPKIGRPIKVVDAKEDWNIYVIPDVGLTLKVKLTVVEIYQIPERYDRYGNPLFVIQSTNVVVPVSKEG